MDFVIKRPILTEKSLAEAGRGWYTFEVDQAADKKKIAREIGIRYSVTVRSVRTMRVHGKTRRTGKRMVPRTRPDWKKAIVRLKDGQTIDAFSVTETSAK